MPARRPSSATPAAAHLVVATGLELGAGLINAAESLVRALLLVAHDPLSLNEPGQDLRDRALSRVGLLTVP